MAIYLLSCVAPMYIRAENPFDGSLRKLTSVN